MTTLHLEHPVTDFATWRRAFDGFANLRAAAGARSHVIRRPVDDANYVLIDLDFDNEEAAAGFLETLRTKIWSSPANSPALSGAPIARPPQHRGNRAPVDLASASEPVALRAPMSRIYRLV